MGHKGKYLLFKNCFLKWNMSLNLDNKVIFYMAENIESFAKNDL